MTTQYTKSNGRLVEIFSLTDMLARFRMKIERESGQRIEDLDLNAAFFLADLSVFIGLGPRQQNAILGPEANEFVIRHTQPDIKRLQ